MHVQSVQKYCFSMSNMQICRVFVAFVVSNMAPQLFQKRAFSCKTKLNHQDHGDKKVTNLHFQRWKEEFCTLYTCFLASLSIHFAGGLVLSSTDLFCSCVDDASTRRNTIKFLFLSLSCSFQFNSRIIIERFVSQTTWNIREIIAETRSYIFRWHYRRCVCEL